MGPVLTDISKTQPCYIFGLQPGSGPFNSNTSNGGFEPPMIVRREMAKGRLFLTEIELVVTYNYEQSALCIPN
jgi:hypothetical protein